MRTVYIVSYKFNPCISKMFLEYEDAINSLKEDFVLTKVICPYDLLENDYFIFNNFYVFENGNIVKKCLPIYQAKSIDIITQSNLSMPSYYKQSGVYYNMIYEINSKFDFAFSLKDIKTNLLLNKYKKGFDSYDILDPNQNKLLKKLKKQYAIETKQTSLDFILSNLEVNFFKSKNIVDDNLKKAIAMSTYIFYINKVFPGIYTSKATLVDVFA